MSTNKTSQLTRHPKTGRLTQVRAEKISAVEGMVLSPRMRKVLDQTKDEPAEVRRRAIRAQFSQKHT